jgi:hypothetical protein
MLISTTAIQRGAGTDRYKKVVFLSKAERQAVRDGKKVYFRSDYLSGGRHGTYWRYVTNYGGDFYPRVPEKEEIQLLEVGDDVCCDAGDGDAVYRKMTATLGMTLRLDERGIYDYESESYIHDDGIDVVADNVIAWLDGSDDSPDDLTDLTGEYASDWDAVVAMFDQWEKIKLSQ